MKKRSIEHNIGYLCLFYLENENIASYSLGVVQNSVRNNFDLVNFKSFPTTFEVANTFPNFSRHKSTLL